MPSASCQTAAIGRVRAVIRHHSPLQHSQSRTPPLPSQLHTRVTRPHTGAPNQWTRATPDGSGPVGAPLRGSPRARKHPTHLAEPRGSPRNPRTDPVGHPHVPHTPRGIREVSKQTVSVSHQGNHGSTQNRIHQTPTKPFIGQRAPVRKKRVPRSKPDSVFQKLLDQFDPARLASAGKVQA